MPLAATAAAPSTAPPAAAPPVRLRFLGTMLTPEGGRVVMLASGDHVVVVRPGLAVEDGYIVQAVDVHAVRLLHAATGHRVDVAIPAAPTGAR